jgi:hypothetical protein
MSRPYEELRAIAEAWGTFTRDPNPTHNDLAIAAYHTMVEKPAVRGVWSGLSSEPKRFLNWLLAQRNMMAIMDDVPGHLSLEPEDAAELIEGVRRVGLVDVDEVLVRGSRVVSSGDNLYSWAPKSQVEAVKRRVVSISAEGAKVLRDVIEESKRPAPTDEVFSTLLAGLEQEDILRIAATWKLPEAHRYYKQELVGVMSEFIAAGRSRETLLDALSPQSKRLFEHVASNGGNVTATAAKQALGLDERELRGALLPLVNRALLWDVLTGESRVLFIPHDILGGSTSAAPSSLPQPKLAASAPYNVENRLSYEMPWDLLTILNMASQSDLSVTLQENRITKRLARRLNDAMIHPADPKGGTDYIDSLIHLAQAIGLLSGATGEDHPALSVTPRTEEWAQLSFSAQRHRLFAFWLEDRKWAEPAAYGTIYWWNSDLTMARKGLAEHLLRLPKNEWLSLDAFLRRLNTVDPFIIWSQEELVRRFGLRVLQGFRSQWFDIEGRIIADMLRTALCWLGAVEVGRDKQKRFVSFRLTESSTELLSAVADKQAAPSSRENGHNRHSAMGKSFLVQPNFEVLVIHPESQPVWNLMKMADLVRHDRVSVYALSKASVLRAIEAGAGADELVQMLQAFSDKGLPQNVEQSIHDWSHLIKRLDLRPVTLIEVDDPSVLDELSASRKTRKYIARRLSPTCAVVIAPDGSDEGADALSRLVRDLRSAGFFPRAVASEQLGESPGKPRQTRRRATNGSTRKVSRGADAEGSTPVPLPRKTGTG